MHCWVVTQWLLVLCINYSPGSIKRILHCTQDWNQHLFVDFGCVLPKIFQNVFVCTFKMNHSYWFPCTWEVKNSNNSTPSNFDEFCWWFSHKADSPLGIPWVYPQHLLAHGWWRVLQQGHWWPLPDSGCCWHDLQGRQGMYKVTEIQDSKFKHNLFRKYTVIHNGIFIMSM